MFHFKIIIKPLINLLCFVGIWCGFTFQTQADNAPPNIILFYCDDLGWMDVGYHGNPFYETPHIDRFAREGVVFTSAYANAPFCSPSRASLMTGHYAPRHQIYIPASAARGPDWSRKLIPPEQKRVLNPSVNTFPEVLKTLGYRAAHIGKWHLGRDEDGPLAHGFDVNVGGNRISKPPSFFSPYNNPDIEDGPKGEYLTDRLTDEAIEFIVDYKDEPFFLYLSHFAPHTPIEAKPELVDYYKSKHNPRGGYDETYAAMMHSLDESFGRILESLEQNDLRENTLILFYSDNGGYALATTNEPLRASKGTIYEGGIRVPLFLQWPAKIKQPATYDIPVNGTDIYPTFLDIAGADLQAYTSDGRSLKDLLLKGTDPSLINRTLFWYVPVYLDSYNWQRYERDGITHKLHLTADGEIKQQRAVEPHPSNLFPAWRTTPVNAVRRGNYKLIEFFERDELELYDLSIDIGETRNIATEQPEIVKLLYKELEKKRALTGAPFPLKANPDYDPSKYFRSN